MRHVREILRLGWTGISRHEIARRTGLAPSTVRETLKRFEDSGLTWPLPDEVTDGVLEARLYKNAGTKQGHRRQVEPDWAIVHRELKRKHVTLSILWDEYIERHPDGYRYSRFCDLYRSWEGKLSVTMRQAHAGGEKLFVDYAGDPAPVVIDRLTGEIRGPGSSSPCSVRPTSPMPRRPGPRGWRTGSAPTRGRLKPSAACRGWSCPTTPRRR